MALSLKDLQPKWISIPEATIDDLQTELERRRLEQEAAEKAARQRAAEEEKARRELARTLPARLRELRDRLTAAVEVDERPTPEEREWSRRLLLGLLSEEERQGAMSGLAAEVRQVQMDAGRLLTELLPSGVDVAEIDELECLAFRAWYQQIRRLAGLEATP